MVQVLLTGVIIAEESMGGYQGLIDRGVKIISHTSQAVSSLVALGVPADSITVLPGDARSTLDEAVIVRNYIVSNPDIDTLILVSSPYHLRRASMIFRKAFKEAGLHLFLPAPAAAEPILILTRTDGGDPRRISSMCLPR